MKEIVNYFSIFILIIYCKSDKIIYVINGAKIIFIGNYKGGVGKITTTFNLACRFANILKSNNLNNNVLVLDLDPQSSLSEILVSSNDLGTYDCKLQKVPNDKTINYVFDIWIKKINKYSNFIPSFKDFPIKYRKNNTEFDFVPCSLFYKSNLEVVGDGLDDIVQNMKNNVEYYQILHSFITDLNGYDYILIDCPPTNNIITSSTFLISDWYVIPTICDGISSNGVVHYIKKIDKIYNRICVESDDADINKMIFGNKPNCAGIFYNLVRGQVNYIDEKQNLIDQLRQIGLGNMVYDEFTNNYINTARNTPKGIAATEDFKGIVDKIYSIINN